MACRLKSMKELAREMMKRKCQEHQEMEKTTQMKQQMFSKEAKKTNETLNEDGQEAAKRNQMKVAKKPRRVPEKTFDASLTIGMSTIRYFEKQEEKTTTGNQVAKIDEERELAGHSRPADDDGQLAADDCESRPAHDEEASTIPVVELDKVVGPMLKRYATHCLKRDLLSI
ncbi:hypothetical protein R1flu_014751 [Riccia fluitans]|uniref:Uncharacterized protein n=1 Tax=Riccia fluitans TaxID=41844 RepID=A0ABD1YHD0_9MARC